jgi:5-methylcytosine-specific restriction endonuclease McrA
MPEVRVTARQKAAVARRARGLCEYCRSPTDYSPQAFSVEHILPRAAGGPTRVDNLALACQGCNNHKFTKTEAPDPTTGEMVPLFHPRR